MSLGETPWRFSDVCEMRLISARYAKFSSVHINDSLADGDVIGCTVPMIDGGKLCMCLYPDFFGARFKKRPMPRTSI